MKYVDLADDVFAILGSEAPLTVSEIRVELRRRHPDYEMVSAGAVRRAVHDLAGVGKAKNVAGAGVAPTGAALWQRAPRS